MKKKLLLFLSLTAVISLKAQRYPASSIPDSLKRDADMVVRLEEKIYEIKSPGKMIEYEHHVYTILNDNGDRFATYRTFYDKFNSINYVNAVLYDANGRELQHFKKKDMQDRAVEGNESLVQDDRVKSGSFSYHTYPYTVDFEEEDDVESAFLIRDWWLPRSVRISMEDSRYSIIAPKDYKIRYKLVNADLSPSITEKGDKRTYSWEIKALAAIPEEPFSVPPTAYEPYMLVGPTGIEMQGYKGDMSTWNDFGLFYGSLQKGRDVLPDDLKAKVHALTDGLRSPAEKVAALYDYLQKNTHYVGIQLGIGGLQTFDANYVANNKYGDCKALSNFMVALLKEAGIKAHAVVIEAGDRPEDFQTDFTHDPFNHVICCVPLQKDTIWLECTSSSLPAGYLSDFTSDRYGLFIDDDGAKLVHTPAYLLADNLQERNITAVLGEDGVLKAQSRTRYRAACQDRLEGMIHELSKEDQMRQLKSQFDLPTYDVSAFDYQEDHSKRLPVIRETLKLSVTDYAQVSGRRIFVNPDVLTRSNVRLEETRERKLGLEFNEEYCHIDTVEIGIPQGYETESRPRDISLRSPFGKYETHTVIGPDKITYYRKFERYSGRFPASDYADVAKFFNEVYKWDHSKIVLVKKG